MRNAAGLDKTCGRETDMRKGKLWPILLTAAAVLMALLMCRVEQQGDLTISAVVEHEGQEERLTCWQSPWETAYIFIPGYAQPDQVRLRVPKDNVFRIGGQPVTDGMTCEGFVPGEKYPLEIPEDAGLYAKKIIFLRSGEVATLYVDVSSGNMKYLHKDKKHSEPGTARLYDEKGRLCYSGQLDTVSGRGQSTWEEEKKSYNIRLDGPADLLGMGAAENWVLLSNSKDASHIRNKMVFDFAAGVDLAFSPDSRWVDLYLNGEYAGLYLLCERLEVHPQRVDIPAQGSALLAKDWEWRFQAEGDPFVFTDNSVALGVRYSGLELEMLGSAVQSVENAILSEDGRDPVTGKAWQDLIDMDSWVKKYLIEEIFANTDGQTLSQYFYLDGSREEGKLFAGPVWDYDLAMIRDPEGYFINRKGVYGSSWMPALFHNAEFYEAVRQQYASVFRPKLQELLQTGIGAYGTRVQRAARMNETRWATGSAPEDTETITAFLKTRMETLDRMWIGSEDAVTVQAFGSRGAFVAYTFKPGDCLPELPEKADALWYYEGGTEPVDMTRPVTENIRIYQLETVREPSREPAPEQTGEPEALPQEQEETPISAVQWLPGAVLLVLLAGLLAAEGTLRGTGKRKSSEKKNSSRSL